MVAAKNAVAAVSTFRKNKPDVVVLDISLPTGNGISVADRLQSFDGIAAAPIIFITSSEDPTVPDRAKRHGGGAFDSTAFDPTAFDIAEINTDLETIKP